MSFRLVPKSVILNDLERRNGVILRKSSRSLSHLLMTSCHLPSGSDSTVNEHVVLRRLLQMHAHMVGQAVEFLGVSSVNTSLRP